MNIILLLTEPLHSYRDDLFLALDASGPYTTDSFHIICSKYESDFNVQTQEFFEQICDNVIMHPLSIAPFNPKTEDYSVYSNNVFSFNIWRLPIMGETMFIPLGYVPTYSKKWNKELLAEYRSSGSEYFGPISNINPSTGEKEKLSWLHSWFLCDGSFFRTNPCFRVYMKDQPPMFRVRNYTVRSFSPPKSDPFSYHLDFSHCDIPYVDLLTCVYG